MLIYFVMFGLALLTAIARRRKSVRQAIVAVAAVFTLIIGLRYEVGADFEQYQFIYSRTIGIPLSDFRSVSSDMGYGAINWVSRQLGSGIVGVNLFCGAILMAGVTRFALAQPTPWLVLVAATPYLIIVIGMGYTRQATAVGFELLALVSLFRGRQLHFVLLVLVGALFHKSVIVVLPLAMFAVQEKNRGHWFLIAATSAVAGYYLLSDHTDHYYQAYVVSDRYYSEGAYPRLAMNAVGGVFVLVYRRVLFLNDAEKTFWTVFAILTLLAFPLLVLSTTAADRLSIYLIPIQLFVCGRLILITRNASMRFLATAAYGSALVVWLMFAGNSFAWIPYKFPPWLF